LVCGTPGTGKSIFCAQVLYHAALKGKKCMYLNLEQDSGKLEKQMKQFGWDVQKAKNLKVVSVDSSKPDLVDYILKEIQKLRYDLIALDSLDSISSSPLSEAEIGKMSMEKISESVVPTVLDVPTVGRMKMKKIFQTIANSKATTLVTSEASKESKWFSRDTVSEFLADAIIVLIATPLGKKLARSLELNKMRHTKLKGGRYNLEIGKKGLVVS
jgi:circadian clock protein KaiC